MNITGLDKAEILRDLYNGSKLQGLGFLQAAADMDIEDARKELKANPSGYFDYLHGRVMKINLRSDTLETHLYNRDNGENAAEEIIAKIEAKS